MVPRPAAAMRRRPFRRHLTRELQGWCPEGRSMVGPAGGCGSSSQCGVLPCCAAARALLRGDFGAALLWRVLICLKLRWTVCLQAGPRLLRLHERVRELHVVGWHCLGALIALRPATRTHLTTFARALCAWQMLFRHPELCAELLNFFACGAAPLLCLTISCDLEISRASQRMLARAKKRIARAVLIARACF